MERISHLNQSVALITLLFSTAGGLNATATVVPEPSTNGLALESSQHPALSPHRDSIQLAQGLIGQCRAAARSLFIYPERSTANPLRALQTDEQVTLAEESGRGGWIAVSSPMNGFVQAKDLKPCSGSPPINSGGSTSASRCRRVSYEGSEGLAIRERPNLNSARVGGLFLDDRVTLTNPPKFIVDNDGREWVQITAPTAGWISNGFPKQGDINLKACF